jgi:4-hydroxy-tetrahydrodipicolinate reductase
MIRVGVAGATGRMGGSISKIISKDRRFKLVAATTSPNNVDLDKEFANNIFLSVDPHALFEGTEMVLDFTVPEALQKHLTYARRYKVAMVIGTTGLHKEHMRMIHEAAKEIPIIYARNTSLGVTLMRGIVAQVAHTLGVEFDIEISEAHHRKKADAPSGTAIALGEAAAEGRGVSFDIVASFNRAGSNVARTPGQIGIHSLRGGAIIGEHTVGFYGADESIEITHKAISRELFAKGAIAAAYWLYEKPAGLYGMEEVFGI